MISVTCQGCGKGYRVNDDAAGKRTKCKACGTEIRIPAAGAAPPPLPVAVEPVDPGGDDWGMAGGTAEVFQPAAAAPPPLPSSRGRSINDMRRTGPPQGFSQPKSGFSLGFKIDRISILLLVGGIIALVFGVREVQLASLSSDTPQRLTCKALLDNGPGNNLNIKLTDFAALTSYVYKKQEHGDKWEEAYIPLVPKADLSRQLQAALKKKGTNLVQSSSFDSGKVRILLKSTHSIDQNALEALVNQGELDGMVVNKIESISREDNALLTQSYPQMNVPDAYIFEEDRKPRGGLGTGLSVLGVVLSLGAVGNTIRPR